jgi:hypothetical protein
MEQDTRELQNDIQYGHGMRKHEPLYGLAPEPGAGGPASTGDSAQPVTEAPVEEAATPGDNTTNLTWGIVFGGVLLLFLLVAILYFGIGNTYNTSPLTTYPVK